MRMPMLLLNSPQDHVVEPAQGDYLAASYGGPLERVLLERSYHVATQDYDKQLIFDRTVEFAQRVTA
jgi:carboxylesterase